MNKEFIPYEQALTLKQLGFDEPCFRFYFEKYAIDSKTGGDIKTGEFYLTDIPKTKTMRCSAPLYQQAFRWFREKYDLQYTIVWNKHYPDTPNEWNVRKNWKDEPIIPYGYGGMCKTYEEAELACLKKLIEIVKNK
jgi:hypothetical protein